MREDDLPAMDSLPVAGLDWLDGGGDSLHFSFDAAASLQVLALSVSFI